MLRWTITSPLISEFVIFRYFIMDNITTNKAGVQNVVSDWIFFFGGGGESQKVALRKYRYIGHEVLLHTHFLNSKDLKGRCHEMDIFLKV
jgi:hypothetical protein